MLFICIDLEHEWYTINDSGWNIFTGSTQRICSSQPVGLGLDGSTSHRLKAAKQQHPESQPIKLSLSSASILLLASDYVYPISVRMEAKLCVLISHEWRNKIFPWQQVKAIWHMALDWMGADKTNIFAWVAPFGFIVLLLLGTSTKKGRSEPVTWQSYLYLDSRKFLFFSNQSTLRGLFVSLHLLSSPCWLLPTHGHFATN